MKYGIYDEYRVVNYKEAFSSVKILYCRDSSGSDKLNISIPEQLDLGGSSDYQDTMCRDEQQASLDVFYYDQALKSVNKDIIKAVSDCSKGNEKGVSYYILTDSNPDTFNVEFLFKPYATTAKDVLSIQVSKATCRSASIRGDILPGETKKLSVVSGKYEYTCTRDRNDTVKVLVAAENSEVTSENVTLPAYEPPVPPPSTYVFRLPQHDGVPLDICLNNSRNCGMPSANYWCVQAGFLGAAGYDVIGPVSHTKTMGDNFECNHPPNTCGMISAVTCRAE